MISYILVYFNKLYIVWVPGGGGGAKRHVTLQLP